MTMLTMMRRCVARSTTALSLSHSPEEGKKASHVSRVVLVLVLWVIMPDPRAEKDSSSAYCPEHGRGGKCGRGTIV